MPSTGSTASGFWRYVSDHVNELISIAFSLVLAGNVVFWFPRVFGLRIRSWGAAFGYILGVALINQIHRFVFRAMRESSAINYAYKFNAATTEWALASATSDVSGQIEIDEHNQRLAAQRAVAQARAIVAEVERTEPTGDHP